MLWSLLPRNVLINTVLYHCEYWTVFFKILLAIFKANCARRSFHLFYTFQSACFSLKFRNRNFHSRLKKKLDLVTKVDECEQHDRTQGEYRCCSSKLSMPYLFDCKSRLQEKSENHRTLTPWRLGGFGDFRKKNSSFQMPYQRPSSSADCARELFNGSNGSASLVDCTRKKNFLLGGCGFFVSDVISEVVLGSFWLMLLDLGPNH